MATTIIFMNAVLPFALGVAFMFGISLMCHSLWYTFSVIEYAAGLFIVADQVFFHMSEFIVATCVRHEDPRPELFMIYHSPQYVIAVLAAWVEFFVECLLVPEEWKISPDGLLGYIFRLNYASVTVAAILTALCYSVRVWGMIHCGKNFSLTIETEHRVNHVLVDDGIYAFLRHPSYFGWFWKTIFSQMILVNPFCLVAYALVSWNFFNERIQYEEYLLESNEFFGEKYKEYRSHTWVGIPFISCRR